MEWNRIMNITLGLIIVAISITSCKHNKTEEGSKALYAKVYKSDSSVQCDIDSAIELETMKQELIDEGIDVICSQKLNDGEPRNAACGIDSGNINVYVINTSNLVDAENIGFNSVDELTEYVDETCE